MQSIIQLLIDAKVQRKALARTKKLGGPAYEKFSNTMVKLYKAIDAASIEDLEQIRQLARKADKLATLKGLGYAIESEH